MNSDMMSSRKDRVLAKLEQRNEERKNTNDEVFSNTEGSKVDQLLKDIRSDLDNQKTDSSKIERLQEYQSLSVSNRQSKAIQTLLEDVRRFKLIKKPVPKFTGFSFSKTSSTQLEKKTDLAPILVSVEEPSVSECNVSNIKNMRKIIIGNHGNEVRLKNVENCRLQFNLEPSVVHIRNVKNSTLLFLRCDRSVLMHDCQNLNIFIAAQQIRIHTSENVRLHVATRGAVILEDSTGILLYPYRLKSTNGEYLQVEDNGEWRSPRDFNWLATTPSPNWRLVPKEEYTDEQMLLDLN